VSGLWPRRRHPLDARWNQELHRIHTWRPPSPTDPSPHRRPARRCLASTGAAAGVRRAAATPLPPSARRSAVPLIPGRAALAGRIGTDAHNRPRAGKTESALHRSTVAVRGRAGKKSGIVVVLELVRTPFLGFSAVCSALLSGRRVRTSGLREDHRRDDSPDANMPVSTSSIRRCSHTGVSTTQPAPVVIDSSGRGHDGRSSPTEHADTGVTRPASSRSTRVAADLRSYPTRPTGPDRKVPVH